MTEQTDDAWLTAERKHEEQMRRLEMDETAETRRHERALSEQRTERMSYVVFGLVVAVIVLGIGYMIWRSSEANQQRKARVEVACADSGGTWTSVGGSPPACWRFDVVEGGR